MPRHTQPRSATTHTGGRRNEISYVKRKSTNPIYTENYFAIVKNTA